MTPSGEHDGPTPTRTRAITTDCGLAPRPEDEVKDSEYMEAKGSEYMEAIRSSFARLGDLSTCIDDEEFGDGKGSDSQSEVTTELETPSSNSSFGEILPRTPNFFVKNTFIEGVASEHGTACQPMMKRRGSWPECRPLGHACFFPDDRNRERARNKPTSTSAPTSASVQPSTTASCQVCPPATADCEHVGKWEMLVCGYLKRQNQNMLLEGMREAVRSVKADGNGGEKEKKQGLIKLAVLPEEQWSLGTLACCTGNGCKGCWERGQKASGGARTCVRGILCKFCHCHPRVKPNQRVRKARGARAEGARRAKDLHEGCVVQVLPSTSPEAQSENEEGNEGGGGR